MTDPPPPAPGPTFRLDCSRCGLRTGCLPAALDPTHLQHLERLITARRLITRGEALFRCGDRFESLFIVHTGFFKTCVIRRDGREQVTGFTTSGDMLGWDGVHEDVHRSDAVALEDSQVCVIPFAALERLARECPPLQRQLHRLMSREIVRDQGVMLLLGGMRAEERVAAFLLDLTRELSTRGFSASRLVLLMTREDIGSFLGLTLETISRTLSRLQHEGVIQVRQREVSLLKPRQLLRLVDRSLR